MLAEQQAEFIGLHLGPAFQKAGLKTKIICYDHNADKPEYPLTVLGNAAARPFVDGAAFHLYAGPIEALSKVHDAYPTKNVYFTEQWTGSKTTFASNLGWHVQNLEIAPRATGPGPCWNGTWPPTRSKTRTRPAAAPSAWAPSRWAPTGR